MLHRCSATLSPPPPSPHTQPTIFVLVCWCKRVNGWQCRPYSVHIRFVCTTSYVLLRVQYTRRYIN